METINFIMMSYTNTDSLAKSFDDNTHSFEIFKMIQ